MNDEDAKLAAFDVRLRSLFGSLDAREGFEARVQARIASLAAFDPATRADLRGRFESRRERERRRFAREAWMNGITIAGLGLTAVALVWRFAPLIRSGGFRRNRASRSIRCRST